MSLKKWDVRRIDFGYYRSTNYPLPHEQRQGHVDPHKKEPYCQDKWDDGAVISLNNTYLEMNDRYYKSRGGGMFFCLVMMLMVSIPVLWVVVDTIFNPLRHTIDDFFLTIFCVCFSSILTIPCTLIILKDGFCLTHYPMRFNRKNRKIYLYGDDNKITTHNWGELYFTIAPYPVLGLRTWALYGLKLTEDQQTVTASVAITIGGFGEVRGYWEFLRAYMNNGPQAVVNDVMLYLPISKRRESYGLGLYQLSHLLSLFGGKESYFWLWFSGLCSIGRIVAMRTSRVPRWNADIDEACRIEENDPYALIQQQSPKFSWSWFRPQYDPKRIKLAELDRRKRARAKASLATDDVDKLDNVHK